MENTAKNQLSNHASLAYKLITITIIVFWMYILGSLATLLLISIILSIAISPVTVWFEKKSFPKGLAVSITVLMLTTLILGFGFLIVNEVKEFSQMWPQIVRKFNLLYKELQSWTYHKFHILPSTQKMKINELANTMQPEDGQGLVGTAVTITSSMLAALSTIPLLIFLILYYRNLLLTFLIKIFGKKNPSGLQQLFGRIYDVIHSYLSGLLLVTIIVGVLNTLGLFILGIESALFFGFLAAVLLIIPYVGILIGAILPIMVALVTKEPVHALGVVAVFVFVQLLEGNLITPYIVGNKISVNSLAVVIALFLGQMLWGIAGMALALPLTAILKVIFDSVDHLKPFGYLLGDDCSEKIEPQKGSKTTWLQKISLIFR